MKRITTIALLSAFVLGGCQTLKDADNLSALGVDFTWMSKHRCSTTPPAFNITGVPEGTAALKFKMTDLDVPTYYHGGGDVAYTGSGIIPEGAFSYKGPCPPSGSHRYKFDVTAVNAAGDMALGRGFATKPFPPE
ncbi:hypothetical protein JCM17960_34690 [Magnetospira thiophila]